MKQIDPEKFSLSPADVEFAIEHNKMYYKRREMPEDYERFINDLKSRGLHTAIVNHYGHVKYRVMRLKKLVKKAIPSSVKRLMKAILRRG